MHLLRKYLIPVIQVAAFTAFLLLSGIAYGQDRKTLEANKKKLENEIAQTEKQLDQTRNRRKNTVAELQLVNSNISKREELISGLNKEVNLTNREINNLSSKITRLSNDIETLKEEYAEMIVSSQRHRNQYSLLMFIFASQDFNQAWRRLRYMGQYNDYLKKQVALIKEKQVVLRDSKEKLEEERESKKELVREQQTAKQKLEKEKQNKNRLVSQLKSKENKLRKQMKEQQKKVNQLNAQIQKIIEEEIRRSQEEARKKGESSSGNTYALTPEEKTLSSNFESNKGKLPWPLERGVISGKFGTHPHPVISSVTVTNNGIDILTDKNAPVRAVFSGEVCNVGSVYGLRFVIIRHGAYVTVYANLDQVYVKEGDKVDTKEKIGRVYYDAEEGKSELQFQVWKSTAKQNPEYWIAK